MTDSTSQTRDLLVTHRQTLQLLQGKQIHKTEICNKLMHQQIVIRIKEYETTR